MLQDIFLFARASGTPFSTKEAQQRQLMKQPPDFLALCFAFWPATKGQDHQGYLLRIGTNSLVCKIHRFPADLTSEQLKEKCRFL